jgi:alcohol dehydrogenase class IV
MKQPHLSSFIFPTKINVVKNLEKEIELIIKNNFSFKVRNILFIYDKILKSQANKIFKNLKDFNIKKLEYDANEPTVEIVENKSKILKEKIDLIIGMGGGSTLDFSKCISIKVKNKLNIWDYTNLSYKPPVIIKNHPVPLCLIPSTAGTGSEVTPYAVLRNFNIGEKGTINDRSIIPILSIISPNLLSTVPKKIKIYTALDAIAHAMESYINTSKKSLISDYFAIEAFNLIFNNLLKAVKINDYSSNLKLSLGCLWAGISISHKGTTVAHAVAETVGGLTNYGHAYCVAVSTPEVLYATRNNKKVNALMINLMKKSKYHNFYKEFMKFYRKLNVKKLKIDKTIYHKFEDVVIKKLYKTKFRPLKFHPTKIKKKDMIKIIKRIVS